MNSELQKIMEKHNLTVNNICIRFGIPDSTFFNWLSGFVPCPSYIIKMIDEIFTLEKQNAELIYRLSE